MKSHAIDDSMYEVELESMHQTKKLERNIHSPLTVNN